MLRKRVFALSAMLGATLLFSSVVNAEQNVAIDRPYSVSTGILEGWTGLNNGVTDSDSGPGCFATTNGDDFPKHVTIDLQHPHSINRIAVHSSANGNTRGIIISCSLDGEEFEELREFIFPQGEPLTLNHRFNDRPAQFVRVTFTNTWGGGLGGDNTIFVREVEVFGTPTGEAPAARPMPAPEGDALVRTRDLRLFRRWGLNSDGPLEITVLGDSFANGGDESWPQRVAERLQYARPDDAEVALELMGDEGLNPSRAIDYVAQIAENEPDVALVTFGTDAKGISRRGFREALTKLLDRLLTETDALVVLIGPAVDSEEQVEIGRQVLDEMELIANLFGLPLLRTEAALLAENLSIADLRNDDGGLTEKSRDVVTTSLLELLLLP